MDDSITVTCIGSLYGHNGWITSLSVGEDANGYPLLISGSRDRTLIVWNLDLENEEVQQNNDEKEIPQSEKKIGKPLKSLKGHSHFVSSVSISKDNNFVISSSWDKTLRLWDLSTFKTKTLLSGHTKDVLCATFTNDNRMIISGGMDKTMRIWNSKGENRYINTDFQGWVSCLSLLKQGKENFVAVGSWDNKVRVFDQKEYSLQKKLGGSDYAVVSIDTDDDGDFLFVGEKNGNVKVWEIGKNEGDILKTTMELGTQLNAVSFSPKYFSVISLATGKGLVIRDIARETDIFEFQPKKHVSCCSLAWDLKREYLFAGFTDGIIRVFKFKSTK
jgi:guanine nucleotide-binding protein subunit beta-2-like 1 protein